MEENVELREANRRLAEERKMSHALVEKLEDEMRRYRADLFLNGPPTRWVKQYERDLIELLRTGGLWNPTTCSRSSGFEEWTRRASVQ